MCGILGYLATTPDLSELRPQLDAALASLNHRGPDDNGTWAEGGLGLGFVRLAILDLSPAGHQPMQSPDGRFVIVFNGEIYNFRELRQQLEAAGERFAGHSDTEILLRLYQREGLERCLARLRGMFAFAIWDRQEKTLALARDRLGVKPLVYAATPRGFAFASEIGALFELLPELPRRPDYVALDQFLSYQYVPSPRTGFDAIRKLPPAHAMQVRHGRVEKLFRYWDISHQAPSPLSFADACAALRELVLESTRLRMVADVPLGAFLSGGVDSSIIVAAMARLSKQPIKTYAIGFADERFNELPHARQIARHLGTEHHEALCHPEAVDLLPRLIRHLGEPFADNSILPTYHVSRFARQDVTVALTGDGGDELFGGYRRHHHIWRVETLEKWGLLPLWRKLRQATVALENRFGSSPTRRVFPHTHADQMLAMDSVARFRHLVAHYTQQDKAHLLTPHFRQLAGESSLANLRDPWERAAGADTLNRWLYVDSQTYLPDDILAKVDIASMAVSLECRSPFLDHKVVEFAMSLPGRYKLTPRGRHKHILKEAFKDWVPPGFFDRNKMGFSAPLPTWLRGDLAPIMREAIANNATLSEWFDTRQLDRLLDEHLAGPHSHSKRLWPFYALAIWVQEFKVTA
ncbi:MAG: asparagine synthase (glutamine-hydrolyzing) [Azovibrio sp.]|uniref:asparagine synthase (glutamine-hydrolyzing) n=1 Tax=Azovibrio sp. TaxID=1872673 RepID=UPI003C71DCB7